MRGVCCWMAAGLLALSAGLVRADDMPPAMAKTVEQLVAQTKPSIVVITFDGRDGERQGLGTGFIVDPGGLIATNLHVIGEARPIRVQLADGRKFDVVSVEATERHHDLAILKVEAKDLPALPLGDSDALQEGQTLVAIGNPLGLDRSVVTGVLSGRREIDERPMLQIAMPIERGNSGGPLLDLQGRVHGLITLKSLKTDNLGFAAPINQLKPLLDDPNPIPMEKWLTIGVLDPEDWTPLFGGRWKQRAGRILVEGSGSGFGGRCLCLSTQAVPAKPYEVAVRVKFSPTEGAAGLVFHADGKDRHYGFYPSNGELRLSRFEGPDVYAWTVLQQVRSAKLIADGWNALKVRIEADRILCYLNDELVIESRDAGLTGGRVGLCKFRQTEAEFRGFRLAESIPSEEPSAELLMRIGQTAADLKLDRPADVETVTAVAMTGPAALAALEQQARQLEQRARRLRDLASSVHERRVREQFRTVVDRPEAELDLLHGALLIAAMDNPDLDIEPYRHEVDRIARRIKSRLPENADDADKLAALKRDLFEEQGFHGSRHDYGNRSNSYLNEVLDDREGLPITLSVLFMEVAKRLELKVVGVGLPGHFLVRYEPAKGPGTLLDPFERGVEMTVAAAKEKITESGREWDDEYLATSSPKGILVRMLRNLFSEARDKADTGRMRRYTDLVLVLQPDSVHDRFYRAVLCLQEDRLDDARQETDWLLDHPTPDLARRALDDLSRAIDRELEQRAK
jgi:serine protease Do